MSVLDDYLKKHRASIIKREEQTFRDILKAYRSIEKELQKSYLKFQKQIEEAIKDGKEISPSWIFQKQRLASLLEDVEKEVVKFGGKIIPVIEREQATAIDLAITQAKEISKLQGAKLNIGASLPKRAIENAVGFMGDGSPLIEYFEQTLAPVVIDKIQEEVIKAVALGTDFKSIAKRLQDTGGITKSRALSVARTEVNRVRRDTTREIFKENNIKQWEWVASKSARTCPLCLSMDGKRFPIDEPFPQHINCRCTMISVMPGRELKRNLGRDWFERQDDATKEKILGKEAFPHYKNGDLALDDFVMFRTDKRFGKAVTRRPLAEILSKKKIDPISKAMKTRVSKFGSLGDWQKIDEKFDASITKQINDASCVSAIGEMLAKHYGLKTNQQEILDNIGDWANSAYLSDFLNTKETKKDVEWIGGFFDDDEQRIIGISKTTKVWGVFLRKGSAIGHAVLIDGVDENDLIIIKDPFDKTTYKMEATELLKILSEFVLRRKKK